MKCSLSAAGIGLLSGSARANDLILNPDLSDEVLFSDPETPQTEVETLKDLERTDLGFSAFSWGFAANTKVPMYPRVDAEKVAKKLVNLSLAFAEAGVSRITHPTTVSRFLRTFGLDLKYPDGTYVPYCAAGLNHALCRAFCELNDLEHDDNTVHRVIRSVSEYYTFPSSSVRDIKNAAEGKGRWIPNGSTVRPKEGWPIVFSWNSRGTPNHVGVVIGSDVKNIETVEYNTSITTVGSKRNGGVVARRVRKNDNTILGFVKIY